ncbi:MAG: hypothetical protein J6Z02_04830 [Lachnospiraceae bacterium]|nr:hypothetical protein [Lachnospiraceae bacterium]
MTDVSKYTKLNMKTTLTDYATMRKNYNKNKYDSDVAAMWWLKSENGSKASYVDGSGTVMSAGLETSARQGVRPVIKLKLQ